MGGGLGAQATHVELSARAALELVDEDHVAWLLVPREVLADPCADVLGAQGRPRRELDERGHDLAPALVGEPEDGGVDDLGDLEEDLLDLAGEHLLPSGVDHTRAAPEELDVAGPKHA